MSKTVYKLVDNGIQTQIVSDDYYLSANETFEKPIDGIYQPFSFKNGVITGATQEEFEDAVHLQSNNRPKIGDELVADLAKQLAASQILQAKTNAQLLQQNAALVKQVAALQSGKETNNG